MFFVDAALVLFSPPGPYRGQQELRAGQLSRERGGRGAAAWTALIRR